MPARFFLTGLFAALLVFFVVRIATWEEARLPPPPGDAQDYDNIAVQILRGRGFALDNTDPERRQPYIENNREGLYDEILSRKSPLALTTYWPPLLPYSLAATYRIFGRSYFAWRMIECLMLAGALTLVCAAAWTAFGPQVALVSAGLMFLSRTYTDYIGYHGLMTEPLATTTIAILVWGMSRFAVAPRRWAAAFCGVALALAGLARSFYVAWIPIVAIFVWWLATRSGATRREALTFAAICMSLAIALQAPWWIRNCVLLGRFMPVGPQSGSTIYTAYSDAAVGHRGAWWLANPAQLRRMYVRELGYECDPSSHVVVAPCLVRGALLWIAHHPRQVPRLAGWKILNTVQRVSEAGLSGRAYWMALAAPLVIWRRRRFIHIPVAAIFVTFVLVNFLVIALTWSSNWRYVVPVEPLLAVLTSLAITLGFFGEAKVARES